ncbi:ABC transporter permease [Tenggerimyces flavus]|uniref:ABC transporter permease n=1 Tax=Tenggerimyces flavus TaxID=1708749 RepID=A0ABV7YQH6_9ACTN|nr:ABC transporter permease [Tenggerimyces flavus]MBM7790461.1 ABC-2 type transport system permease protein [Tenggerimyces flavus]
MNALVGTGKLVRLILRRDRFLLPIWILLFGLLPTTYISAITELYPTVAQQALYAQTAGANPTFLSLYGPIWSHDIGGIVTQRAGFLPIMIALISVLTVIRHTRTEEEAGRRELLGATVVGRHAGLAAALIVTVVANLLIAGIVFGAFVGQDMAVDGSLALGLEFAFAGILGAAIGGLGAQLTTGAGSARGFAIAVLGAFFVLRVAGDVGGESSSVSWLSWLSPMGWVQRVRPFGDEQWWTLALVGGLAVVLFIAAVAISARRDVAAGVFPPRLGPADAAPSLRSPVALAWRLHRTLLYSWAAAFAALGLVFGSVAASVQDLLEDSAQIKEMFERIGGGVDIVDVTLATTLGILGLIATGYAIQATLRMRAEETEGRAEPVLATHVGRLQWVASHVVFALLGPAVVLAVAGLTAGVTHGANVGNIGEQVPRVLAGALVQLPAVWVLVGLALLLFGLLPRIAAAVWGVFGLFVLLGQVGSFLGLEQWMLDASPYSHLPLLPGGEWTATPLLTLLGIALVLGAVGFVGFRRRDVG